jgi:hypothetical protein
MGIQIRHIKGDIVELFFDPHHTDLRVGENLSIRERDTGCGLVVQVVELQTVTYPALLQEMLALIAGEPMAAAAASLAQMAEASFSPAGNCKVALAKIRKTVGGHWDHWDGWIPTRDVEIERTPDEELLGQCVRLEGNPIALGHTLYGAPFTIEGRKLEKVNVITGVKGAGKSHLAKVILLQLIERGAPCIVFDINREYIHLPRHRVNPASGEVRGRGVMHLDAGGSFKLGVHQFGLPPLMTLLTRYGLPEVSAMHFENRMNRLFAELDQWERPGTTPPFIGLKQLIEMAEAGEFGSGSQSVIINGAIRSRLEALRHTGIFANARQEAVSLKTYYSWVREGGALVIDLSRLSNLARTGLVQALLELVKDVCQAEIEAGTHRFPFVFFEEAHLYVSRASIDYIVTRARHLGITSFFVTNMISGLDEAVLRQADNLFLLRLPFEDDARHVAKTAATDYETLSAFVRRLKGWHAMLIGRATEGYPLLFQVDRLAGVNTAGETKYFFAKEGPLQASTQEPLPLF